MPLERKKIPIFPGSRQKKEIKTPMHFSVYAMANIGNDEAAKEAKILALAAALKDHREALHFIPEIFEQFTALRKTSNKR